MPKKILIISDSLAERELVQAVLGAEYNYLEADDGDKGADIARRELPDLCIAKSLMNHCTGERMLLNLKTDQDLQNIKAVLLSDAAPRRDYCQKWNGFDVVSLKTIIEELPNLVHSLLGEKLARQTPATVVKNYHRVSGQMLTLLARKV